MYHTNDVILAQQHSTQASRTGNPLETSFDSVFYVKTGAAEVGLLTQGPYRCGSCEGAVGGDRQADMVESLDFISIWLPDNKKDHDG